MNTKEYIIKKIERELAELKRQVEREQFKEGDWVVCRSHENGSSALVRYSDDQLQTGFNYAGDWSDGVSPYFKNSAYTHRLATKDEIETALRKEWDRRCKKAGWESGKEAHIVAHADESVTSPINCHYLPYYIQRMDRLWTSNGIVYQNGKWATPKPERTTYRPQWFAETTANEIVQYVVKCDDPNAPTPDKWFDLDKADELIEYLIACRGLNYDLVVEKFDTEEEYVTSEMVIIGNNFKNNN